MGKIKRIYHTWDKWECYPAGFYENGDASKDDETCRIMYRDFLADLPRFEKALNKVLKNWVNSCEHYLTNEAYNRVAWLGQAAACIDMGLPQKYRGGYFSLSPEQQKAADNMALNYLNKWLNSHGYESIDLDGAGVNTKVNLY